MEAPRARARVWTRFRYAFVFICDAWQAMAASHSDSMLLVSITMSGFDKEVCVME